MFCPAASPLYFKAPVTAVAAAAVKGDACGLAAIGTEEGRVMLVAVHKTMAGGLEHPSVLWDRQAAPRRYPPEGHSTRYRRAHLS